MAREANQTILALDPATLCGFAVGIDGKVVSSGVWNLKPKNDTRPGQRGLRLFEYLHQIWQEYEPNECYFEKVERHPGASPKIKCPACGNKFEAKGISLTNIYAAQTFGGLKMVIEIWCEMHKIKYQGIPVGTIKKIATGRGNATKDDMIAMAKLRWRDIQILDDNHADALWIYEAAIELKRPRQSALF